MLKHPWNKFGENTSIAQSKSSKTIKSKFIVNNQEQSAPPPIYFKEDPMREQINLRAKRQTNKISPQPKKKEDRLTKISKIVSDLHKRKDQAKKRLQNLKQEADEQMQKICPFTPQKRKVPKYIVTGDVIRRNQVWMQQKTKKHLYLKEQRTLQQLKQCTFSPNFQAKKQSQAILKNKNGRSLTPRKSLTNYETGTKMNSFYSPSRSRKTDITAQQYQTAKRHLVTKIMNTRIL